jgi:hypothetical protein
MSRWLSVLLGVVLALVVAEVGFRVLWLGYLTIPAGIEDPHFHHRLRPLETYSFSSSEFEAKTRTNRYGLRGPDPIIPKSAGVTRILMLGDSFTFGFPVQDQETFCHLIEEGLRAQGHRVEVINGGVSGYSPTLEYISLRDQFLAFEPDLVVLWYDFGDLQEDHWFQKNLVYDERGAIVRADPWYTHGRFDRWVWLQHKSALAKYLDTKLVRTLRKIRTLGLAGYVNAKLRGERSKVAIARLKAERRAADLAEYDRFLMVRETSTEESLEPYWALSARYLRLIHALLAEQGIPFLIGVYPYGMLVGPDQWGAGRMSWGFERGRVYDATAALAILRRFCEEEQVPFIETIGSFREAASERLFYDEDGHLTPEGHRVLAGHILRDPQVLRAVRQQLAEARGLSAR